MLRTSIFQGPSAAMLRVFNYPEKYDNRRTESPEERSDEGLTKYFMRNTLT